MKQVVRFESRKELKAKMLKVFRKNIATLSKEMQEILMDDLVTAFQSRMSVLSKVHEKVTLDASLSCITLETDLQHDSV